MLTGLGDRLPIVYKILTNPRIELCDRFGVETCDRGRSPCRLNCQLKH
ncbi:hypothetical protein [Oxynema aestuarii]|uniref:Uncharacterized protein n=1 Tax=Oxynema aestuarii AP17 TaxID=2064643 RepID=A0A6H1U2X3_9CYAN|nr:hypothetical protein [Oxynema aestuarii]QIZ71969.1 hypothetical protein HCG48_16415 [Oxynema aestuarii AP17]